MMALGAPLANALGQPDSEQPSLSASSGSMPPLPMPPLPPPWFVCPRPDEFLPHAYANCPMRLLWQAAAIGLHMQPVLGLWPDGPLAGPVPAGNQPASMQKVLSASPL